MYDDSSILAVIPARGGSKGFPGKNIRPLLGKPLLAWTIMQAQRSAHIDEVIVSTNSKDIAAIAEEHGVKVPFLRPEELSTDRALSAAAVVHVLDWFLENKKQAFDVVMMLEPTSPLRRRGDLDHAVETMLASDSDPTSLVSLGEVHIEHPSIVKVLDERKFVKPFIKDGQQVHQRQQLQTVYFPYGVVYMSRVDAFRRYMTFYQEKTIGYHIQRWQNYEIDDLLDFLCVEAILREMIGEIQ